MPIEIGLERCRRRLLCIASAGLLAISDPAASINVIRDISGNPSTLIRKPYSAALRQHKPLPFVNKP